MNDTRILIFPYTIGQWFRSYLLARCEKPQCVENNRRKTVQHGPSGCRIHRSETSQVGMNQTPVRTEGVDNALDPFADDDLRVSGVSRSDLLVQSKWYRSRGRSGASALIARDFASG
jgi:hypothetical protein